MKKEYLKMIAVLPLAAVLVSCGRVTIDPNDYLNVEFDGLDTVASADYEIDYEKMVMDNLKAFGIKDKDDEHDIERAVRKLKKYLSGELDEDEELSNGDKITFEWNEDDIERLEKKYNIKLKISDKTIEVKDLEVPKEFDPFDYITLNYSGVGPDANLSIEVDEDIPVSGLGFYADKSYGLSNGDKITITFGSSYYDEDEILEYCFREKCKPTELKKEFKVEGVQSYVEKIDDIEKSAYDKMDKYALDKFNELADTWEDKKLKDAELVGVDLLVPKNPSVFTPHNALCYVYKVTVNAPEGDKEEEKTEPATEAEKVTATETTTTKAEEKKDDKTTTTAADDKKSDENTTTTAEKSEDKEKTTEAKKDEKKDDKKDGSKFEYYYFTVFENVVTPDNKKDSEYPASYVRVPDYYTFFGSISGDAFMKGDVVYEGYETLDALKKALEEKYPDSKFETNIKK